LRGVEAAIPRPGRVKSYISSHEPDVVVVSPLTEFGSAQADYVRVATAAGIRSVLVVAREDELVGGGVIRHAPTLTVTSSEAGLNDLVRFHRVPRERIVTAGASESVEAIERAARMDAGSERQGRLLRPLLWLLTPLLAVLLVLLRPRATLRAAIRAPGRLVTRMRKRARTRRRRRAEQSKASAGTAKAQRLAATEQLRAQKKARAEAKAQKMARAAGASATNGGESSSADAKEPPAEQPRG
jgi:Sec-independent protein translocase protein TatA